MHLAAATSEPTRAVRLGGMASALRRTTLDRSSPIWRLMDSWLAPACAQLGPRRASAAHAAGESASLDEAISFALGEEPSRPAPGGTDDWLALSSREREVVALLGEGLSNRDIAERLVVGERTVETHVHNVLRKLGVRSRHQVVDWATTHAVIG
jgi:ATP/maltotriose-dependent transcriptional regulator MalT